MRNQRDVQSVRKVLSSKFKTHLKGIKEELRKLLENWEVQIENKQLAVRPLRMDLSKLCDPYKASNALQQATNYYESVSTNLNNNDNESIK